MPSLISPFSITNALFASTEKSPEIGFAVCAPKTLVVIIPESISSIPTFVLNLNSKFEGDTSGVVKYDPLYPFDVLSQSALLEL